MTSIALALLLTGRSIQAVAKLHPEARLGDIAVLWAAEKRIRDVGGTLAHLLNRADEVIGPLVDYDEPLPPLDGTGDGVSDLFFDFDLFGWDPHFSINEASMLLAPPVNQTYTMPSRRPTGDVPGLRDMEDQYA